ncbi:WSC-domain-containing protein [Hypoxylon fragiforme]|uniref:WSC-domain-containing protein n=1 Tax=Hypoxylon fragiforme TaxID=63214 RepID=UPI0020C6D4C2|nr:WSC-domain-containing protein [Hypoxylon fragiforme]KAI2613481.1 WSC-domain-containing protein [Hypoxylon fragiforme]
MANLKRALVGLLATSSSYFIYGVEAYWRMSCSLIQTSRLDPIVSPGAVSAHVHKVSGASNFGLSNTYQDLIDSQCTSCEIQDDKSIYWTPQLYYEHANGSFEEVPNGGTVVYYLGRGENRSNIEPFPPGFKMVSGDPYLRADSTTAVTSSNNNNFQTRPISDRVSFNCLDSSGSAPEKNYMFSTDCDNGLRAQIQFPSCWNGQDYQRDQSHVAYMSGIDNGICPPSHPRQLVHLFFEVLYGVNDIKKEAGGRFVFANGDPTGFGFHGDFMNGWEMDVLKAAISTCANDDSSNGQISKCPPLAKSQNPYYATNCPERPAIVNEKVRGMIDCLPGCNVVTTGPERAVQLICPDDSPSVSENKDEGPFTMFSPTVGQVLSGTTFAYAGCATDNGNPRTLGGYSFKAHNMTIESCTSACKAQGYILAGLEYSTECYCGISINSGALSDCSTTSKMVCAGNATEWCGAPNLLTIWSDTSYSASATTLSIDSTTINNGSATYLGCFSDPGGNSRALQGDSKVNTTAMTNEMCVSYCREKGYPLAGTEYSQECYCSNVNTGTLISDDSQCSMKCKGDSPRACGGSLRLSVWNITQNRGVQSQSTQTQTQTISTRSTQSQSQATSTQLSQASASASASASVLKAANGTANYVGCYTDKGSDGRTLTGDFQYGDSTTVESCAKYCQAKNYALFGMEYGQECYCGNAPKASSALSAEADCGMPCKGNPTQLCGGSSRISIWNNTLYVPTHNMVTSTDGGYAYFGCYTEGTNGRALGSGTKPSASFTDAGMTVEKCASYCLGKGYSYMGVEYGQECYCNSEGPRNGAAKANEADCGMACKGDITEWCGGSSRISVYKSP